MTDTGQSRQTHSSDTSLFALHRYRWRLHAFPRIVSILVLFSSLVRSFSLPPPQLQHHPSQPSQPSQPPYRLRTTTTTMTTSQLSCQLLGMNCAVESEFALTWPDFCERGGGSDIHADGWGLAYYVGNGIRQFHDTEPASTSPLARFLTEQGQPPQGHQHEGHGVSTRNLLAHIRYATSGAVNLANVHPFAREMWAVNWCFCHNGQIPLFDDHPNHVLGRQQKNDDGDDKLSTVATDQRFYTPIGTTDSEAAFCAILNALRAEFTDAMPTLPALYDKLSTLCAEIVEYNRETTILNFLLTCGPHVLWVFSWPGARPGSEVWNGLHYTVRTQQDDTLELGDEDVTVALKTGGPDGSSGSSSTAVCIVATKPLTEDEEWIELAPGELIVLDEGVPHVTARSLFQVELQGHGLNNNGKVLNPPRLEEDMRRYKFHPEFFVGGGI